MNARKKPDQLSQRNRDGGVVALAESVTASLLRLWAVPA